MVCSIAALVIGEMALASMKVSDAPLWVRACAISAPTLGASKVGTIESTASTVVTNRSRVGTTSS
jgi:hypothetical protein